MLPGPVGLDWSAIEFSGLEFIEAGFDQNRYLPTVQSDVDRLPGAQEARADGQVHRHVGELRAEDTRLYSPPGSQRDWARRVAAEHVCSVRCRLGMAGEEKQAKYLSRHPHLLPLVHRIGRGITQNVRCTPAIGQAPHVVQDAEVPFLLQSRPFKVLAASVLEKALS